MKWLNIGKKARIFQNLHFLQYSVLLRKIEYEIVIGRKGNINRRHGYAKIQITPEIVIGQEYEYYKQIFHKISSQKTYTLVYFQSQ